MRPKDTPRKAKAGAGSSGASKANKICQAFMKGECANGDECKLAHTIDGNDVRRICKAFQTKEGCKRDSCDFAHVKLTEESAKILNSYVKARTDRTPSPAREVRMCPNSTAGDCSYGDQCKFRHGDDDKRPKGKGKGKGKGNAKAAPAAKDAPAAAEE